LIDGEIVEKAMATEEHAYVTENVTLLIAPYLREKKLGRSGPKIRYRKLEDHANSLLPDWSFRLNLAEQSVVTRGAVPVMPDFVLEVQSPDDSIPEMRRKAAIYLRLGTRLVWLALPRQKVILALWADGDEQVCSVEDTFDFGDLLPGFSTAIGAVFALE